jgi:hypothetical protein
MVGTGKSQKNYAVWLLIILFCAALSCLLPGTVKGQVGESTKEIEVAPGQVITESEITSEAVSGGEDEEGGGGGEGAISQGWPITFTDTEKSFATAIAVDSQRNALYVTGRAWSETTGWDYLTIKYNTVTRQKLWHEVYDGGARDFDEARAIAVDNEGNVYVTGYATGNGTGVDFRTIKYSPSGVRLWPSGQYPDKGRYNGPSNYGVATTDDFATAIAISPVAENNGQGSYYPIYVTGCTEGYGNGWDYVIIKYHPDGTKLWDKHWNRNGQNRHDCSSALAVDGQGNIYITGYSYLGFDRGYDYITIKYTPDGTRDWVMSYNNANKNGHDYASAVAVDPQGNVFVTGSSQGLEKGCDYLTIAYNSDGGWYWNSHFKRYQGSDHDFARAIAVSDTPQSDSQGSYYPVYVTGLSIKGADNLDFVTIAYTNRTDGERKWTRAYNKAGKWDEPAAVAVKNGSVYVGGTATGGILSNGSTDSHATKYNPDGTRRIYKHDGTEDAGATAIAVDNNRCVYVTGFINSPPKVRWIIKSILSNTNREME